MTTPSALSYEQIEASILAACQKSTVTFARGADGRIDSATSEPIYLAHLRSSVEADGIPVEIPRARHWWDVRIGGIPINLKLTTCVSADNAGSSWKHALLYTKTGLEPPRGSLNLNEFWKEWTKTPVKSARNRATEYHYLVVNKTTGAFLFKSILDLHPDTPRPNADNELQFSWKNEFRNADYKIPDEEQLRAHRYILSVIQKSHRMEEERRSEFMAADLTPIAATGGAGTSD
jgi:hypothetical protein